MPRQLGQAYEQRRRGILASLASNCGDKSRKGSVDERALPIIRLINARADMFTTSSCSGRISVFAEPTEVNRQSGKKGGEWVYCSHEPADEEEVVSRLAARCHTGCTLVLRFEPFLLHAECRDMAAASWLLQAARGAGFRESGVTTGARGSRVMAGVRCALRLEVPVADGGALLVGDTYLRYLVALANTKFGLNTARMRHLELLLRPPSPETHPLTPTGAPTPSSPPTPPGPDTDPVLPGSGPTPLNASSHSNRRTVPPPAPP
ncbi:methyltransferase TYW3-domain-containing protein, partial [Haematococcus lacustris]